VVVGVVVVAVVVAGGATWKVKNSGAVGAKSWKRTPAAPTHDVRTIQLNAATFPRSARLISSVTPTPGSKRPLRGAEGTRFQTMPDHA
jgi:hypothetical protein